MTNQEILTKAIQKAIDGGWPPEVMAEKLLDGTAQLSQHNGFAFIECASEDLALEAIIFNHQFAKALWGEYKPEEIPIGTPMDGKYPDNLTHRGLRKWQYHLQQMVIAEDPVKYLGDHL